MIWYELICIIVLTNMNKVNKSTVMQWVIYGYGYGYNTDK